jgi:predicted RNA polymerase sigma factor
MLDPLEATRRWPVDGVPANHGAWLTTVARNRALNRLRDQRRRGGPPLLLEDGLDAATTGDVAEHADLDGFGDDRLRLVVLCCHPSLGRGAQVALTLRLVGGLTAREIANAFVQREATVAQRISRAKRSLRARRARFELPPVAELPARLGAVLEVVYLVFNEGYGPHSPDGRRRSLCQEASMLADQLTEIAPMVPEVWGLAALLHFQSSRFDARLAPGGALVPLDEQDRRRWDRRQTRLGEGCLAAGHNAAGPGRPVGPYLLQAEIAARHARAPSLADTDWPPRSARHPRPGRGRPGRLPPAGRDPSRPAAPWRTNRRGGRAVPGPRRRRPDRAAAAPVPATPDRVRRLLSTRSGLWCER